MNLKLKKTIFFSVILFKGLTAWSTEWALPHVSVAHVRTEPRHGAELSTQALMGTPLRVVERRDGGWSLVEMPDGYTGFIIDNSLTFKPDSSMNEWRESERMIVTARHQVWAYEDSIGFREVTDLVAGDIVEREGDLSGLRTMIKLPDGRTGWVHSTDVEPLSGFSKEDVAAAIEIARAQMGTPYLWGGLSVKGMDCSGLVKIAFMAQGKIMPRDASQQARVGEVVEISALKPGDLVFYGNPATGRINHVAIYIGGGMVIESAGRVRLTPVPLAGNVVSCRRVAGDAVPSVDSHQWYINSK